MSIEIPAKIVTAAELENYSDEMRYELANGELATMPFEGGQHGRITAIIGFILKRHVKENQLGVVYAAETGFLLTRDPDTVLAPDVAFVSRSRVDGIEDEVKFIPFAPDLAIEVLSPSDRFTRTEKKAFAWIEHDTKLVLLVDPESKRVHSIRSKRSIVVHELEETIDCSDAVSGWQLKIREVFGSP
jgi:Uma2 family endonuclease